MRKLLFLVVCLIPVFTSGQQDTVASSDLVISDSGSVVLCNAKPFNGTSMDYFDNGQPLRARAYKDGMQISMTEWFPNGQMKSFARYKTGEVRLCKSEKKRGRYCIWFGDCSEKVTMRQVVGLWKRWDQQGNLWMNERRRFRKRICYRTQKPLPF